MVQKILDKDYFNNIRGAVYIPAKAYNAFQMWQDYSSEETGRDMGYAKSVGLNSLRIWVSYEYWKRDRDGFTEKYNDFLNRAHARGMRIMPSLFEHCGVEPSEAALQDRNPETALAVRSPAAEIVKEPVLWGEPLKFVQWFMDNYRDDERLLAIEVMNEPDFEDNYLGFAKAMLIKADQSRGRIPLTMGSIKLNYNLFFMNYGLDILQTHHNFPQSQDDFLEVLKEAGEVQRITEKPVWLTEWQRIRTGGTGWNGEALESPELVPDLASLAGMVKESGLGSFFWSLMVKPAYLPPQRKIGTFNGLFHEDGAVYSLEDARAISGNPGFKASERREKPCHVIRAGFPGKIGL